MAKQNWKKVASGSVTSPVGFVASGLHCGIKARSKKPDASLIVSKSPCVAAATFTVNRVKAWPVLFSEKVMKNAHHRAILASSGNANCVNGAKGKKAVEESVKELAKTLKVREKEILIAQTGLIGAPFPITRFKRAIPDLVKGLSRKGAHKAALGILTTDTCAKEVALSTKIGGKKVTVGGVAKGAGMIHPHMATMLAFLTTDAAISKSLLKKALKQAVDATFNQIAIDNDMSTNDTAFVLANGEAGNASIQKVGKEFKQFQTLLEEVCRLLSYSLVDDGEGVRHVCTLKISGAKNTKDAEKVARAIANSMLFKTMLAGSDPNWGRIVACVGASGIDFNYDSLAIHIGDVPVLMQGKVKIRNLPKARKVLKKKHYDIEVQVGRGRGKTEFITSDLTTQYVEINSEYC